IKATELLFQLIHHQYPEEKRIILSTEITLTDSIQQQEM
ncbi:LacI family transcriptional regulator, partial [Enterococcus faecium]|nr:LacI family transcriptional regulator [Enterococcus faecium]MDT6408615.1 LacI family transcriptional regulator [Enterococcus faecium]